MAFDRVLSYHVTEKNRDIREIYEKVKKRVFTIEYREGSKNKTPFFRNKTKAKEKNMRQTLLWVLGIGVILFLAVLAINATRGGNVRSTHDRVEKAYEETKGSAQEGLRDMKRGVEDATENLKR